MAKEIGGYFGLEENRGAEYHGGALALNLGRTAFLYFLKSVNVTCVYAPELLCDSMTSICEREGIALRFYRQDAYLMPKLSAKMADGEWLLLVNYLGQLSDEKIKASRTMFGNIIVDHTHSFFQRPVEGVPTLYSCRKFFGLPDGAYLYTPLQLDEPDEVDISFGRMSHVMGRFEETGSAHYAELHRVADGYYQATPKAMSKLTRNLLRGIDYEAACARRNENYAVLDSLLKDVNAIRSEGIAGVLSPFQTSDGPLAYPLYCTEGVVLRKRLAEHKVYVPTYWNNVIRSCDARSVEYQCAANILPLPCDQRYSSDDMHRVATLARELM